MKSFSFRRYTEARMMMENLFQDKDIKGGF